MTTNASYCGTHAPSPCYWGLRDALLPPGGGHGRACPAYWSDLCGSRLGWRLTSTRCTCGLKVDDDRLERLVVELSSLVPQESALEVAAVLPSGLADLVVRNRVPRQLLEAIGHVQRSTSSPAAAA